MCRLEELRKTIIAALFSVPISMLFVFLVGWGLYEVGIIDDVFLERLSTVLRWS
jgi:hypothetical protein